MSKYKILRIIVQLVVIDMFFIGVGLFNFFMSLNTSWLWMCVGGVVCFMLLSFAYVYVEKYWNDGQVN